MKKAPAKKAASKKDSKKKNADSDEDDYVPEKEEPDEAFDIKLEEEADDVNPAEDEEDGEDGDAGDLYRVKKRGKRANVSKSRKKKEPKRSGRTIVRVDPVTLEHKRVLDTHVEADVGDPEFERQLVEFLETGMCPKCQSTLKRAHERHLKLYVLVGDAMDVRCFLTASLLLPYCFLTASLLLPHCFLTASLPRSNFVIRAVAAGVPRKTRSGETTKGRSWRPCRQRCSRGKRLKPPG